MTLAVEAASGCWTRAQSRVMTALSNSTAFQSLTDTGTAAAALVWIFGQQVRDPADGHIYTLEEMARLRAYAQVYSSPEDAYGWDHRGGGRLLKSGNLIIYVARQVREYEKGSGESPLGMERLMERRIEDMMDEIWTYMDTNSGPFVNSMRVTAGPGTNPEDEWDSIGCVQAVELEMSWGYSRQ